MVINYAQGNTTIFDGDVNSMMNALGGFGIFNGCSVSKGSGDWDIDVTAGDVYIEDSGLANVSAGTVTITDSSGLASGESRITIITADTSGTLASVDGSAATNPDSPNIPTDEVLLGFVLVSDTDSTAADSDILDIPALMSVDYEQQSAAVWSEGLAPGLGG